MTRIGIAIPLALLVVSLAGCAAGPAEPAAERRDFPLVVPFSMDELPEFADVEAEIVGDRLLMLDDPLRSDRAMRALIPTVLYPPGATEPQPLPDDFAAYLVELHGDEVSERTTLEVAGTTAEVMTVRVGDEEAGFGTLGCLDHSFAADDDAGCYELVFDRTYRIAVLEHDGETVLVWVRTSAEREDPDFFAEFDAALATLAFD